MAVTVLLAWRRGGGAERAGAVLMLIASLLVQLIHLILPVSLQAYALLIDEAALAAGFLLVALRYFSPWLGVAMILQAIQFSLHAYYLIGEKDHDDLYKIVNNVNTFAILLIILAATLLAWRRRAGLAAK
jgi:heme/copper-type cytochrome/quinol oxidase subunit 4